MTVILLLLKKYWKQIVVAIAITIACYIVYDYIYDKGFMASEVACQKRMEEYKIDLDKRIKDLVDMSEAQNKARQQNADSIKADLDKIYRASRAKPLTIIKEGKCLPSENFIDSFNAAIDRVNQK